MGKYKVWFEHHQGPYSIAMDAEDADEIADAFVNDPFFICAVPLDDDYVPVGRLGTGLSPAPIEMAA